IRSFVRRFFNPGKLPDKLFTRTMSERKTKSAKPKRVSRQTKKTSQTISDRRSGGRRTVLTPAIQEVIIAALKAGNYLSVAAEFAGLSPA
ncbi:hypothetical protein, partial [Bacillus amyloliquefaciens]|uniref:hypothetical protein n=1 Tax=Bacillus amyloliquefaciens TaxID=1390 RepID=UPI003F683DC0